jgi:hypothetical protein
MIGRCLVDYFGVEVQVVSRMNDARAFHSWLTVGGLIVDMTHDQWEQTQTALPRNQWIFEHSTAWHDSFNVEAPSIEGFGPLLPAIALKKTFPTLFEQIVTCARSALSDG